MTFRPPDWERRLRDLERRADNRGTDIVRLWGRLPQVVEFPGVAMPQIIPSSTTPSPTTTTTTTSTSSTTTSSTTTSSTTTTSPPLSCYSTWPTEVTVSAGAFTPSGGSAITDTMDGVFSCQPYSCSVSTGVASLIYQSPITYPAGGDIYRWRVFVTLKCNSFTSGSSHWGDPSNIWYPLSLEVRYAGFIAAASCVYAFDPELVPYIGTGNNANQLLGDTYSVPVDFYASGISAAPSSVSIQFSSSAIP